MVAVTAEWEVVERRRVAYEPDNTRFIYHHAAEIARNKAEPLIATARLQAADKACKQLQDLISAVSASGTAVVGACVPGRNSKLPGALGDILAVHARIHAAEGAFYRDILADALRGLGVPVRRAPERDLWAIAGTEMDCREDRLRDRLAALGKELGPPWSEDQKLACLAAFIALKT